MTACRKIINIRIRMDNNKTTLRRYGGFLYDPMGLRSSIFMHPLRQTPPTRLPFPANRV